MIRNPGVSNFDVAEMEAFGEKLPVETLQPPYHLFRRDIEKDVLPCTAEHDIGVRVYGPLAHGLLSGGPHADVDFPAGDWRASSEVFHGAAFRQNLTVVDELAHLARELGITLGQLAMPRRAPQHPRDARSPGDGASWCALAEGPGCQRGAQRAGERHEASRTLSDDSWGRVPRLSDMLSQPNGLRSNGVTEGEGSA